MRKLTTIFFIFLFSVITLSAQKANVYASELKYDAVKQEVSFTLNDLVTLLEIKVYDAAENEVHTVTFNDGLEKGKNTLKLVLPSNLPQGEYSWEITATGEEVKEITRITEKEEQLRFSRAFGVAVDNNFDSPTFGRIYVGERGGQPKEGEAVVRTTQNGVYILNSAFEDVTQQSDLAYTGGATWDLSGSMSSLRVSVAPDGKVYVCDWTSINSEIWIMDPEKPAEDFKRVFSGELTRNEKGLATNSEGIAVHGTVAHCWITGTGEETKLFTLDKDYVDGVVKNGLSLLRYDIGTLETPWDKAPSAVVYDNTTGGKKLYQTNINIRPDLKGGWWIAQFRGEATQNVTGTPSLIHVNAEGMIDFNSGEPENKPIVPFSYTGAIALNEAGDLMAFGSKNNMVHIYTVEYNDEAPYVVLNPIDSISPFLGNHTNGLSFDCADNLYGVSRTGELLGAWALVKGENTFTTPAPKVQKIVVGTPSGIEALKLDEHIVVYPNPVLDVLNIKIENLKVERVELYDLSGRLILSELSNFNSSPYQYQLNMSSLNTGMYILKVKTTKGTVVRQIIKKTVR